MRDIVGGGDFISVEKERTSKLNRLSQRAGGATDQIQFGGSLNR